MNADTIARAAADRNDQTVRGGRQKTKETVETCRTSAKTGAGTPSIRTDSRIGKLTATATEPLHDCPNWQSVSFFEWWGLSGDFFMAPSGQQSCFATGADLTGQFWAADALATPPTARDKATNSVSQIRRMILI
jgi:hypothetical protein